MCFLIRNGFIIHLGLLFCPESPAWLLNKGREEEALNAMEKLRGDVSLAKMEIYRIQTNIEKTACNVDNEKSILTRLHEALLDASFLKPFGLMLAILVFGFCLSGTAPIGFYFVTILKMAEVPVDPFLASAVVNFARPFISLVTPYLVTRFKRRPLLFVNGSIMCFGEN